MTVNVPGFLRMRRIGRYRQLMALIRRSDTPDVAGEVLQYIRQDLAGMDARMRDVASRAEEAQSGVERIRMDVCRLTAMRDRYKKGSDQYKMYPQRVKDLRQSQRILNGLYRGYRAEFEMLEKDRAFYQKIMSEEDG